MPNNLEIPTQPQVNLVPIRSAYFSGEFWTMWDRLMDKDRAAYTLGWIAELESAVQRMERRVRRLANPDEKER
jgi:hypothetical protein